MLKLLAAVLRNGMFRPAPAAASAQAPKIALQLPRREANAATCPNLSIDQLPWPCPLRARGIVL